MYNIKIYYENMDFHIHINISIHDPEANGQVESTHKKMQKAINIGLAEKSISFNINECINDHLYYYNHLKKHTSTQFIPKDVKNITGPLIIENVKKKNQINKVLFMLMIIIKNLILTINIY